MRGGVGRRVDCVAALTLGSLFDGIGGFPLAAKRVGIKPVWASEIEPFCVSVTKRHFPEMLHLGDIRGINGAEIEPVDIITFGSPCQDLSVAGKREGLEGKNSSLFYEAIRIIREMREATNGRYPTFAVWENVPGAFSSNQGRDFAAVLSALVGTKVDLPAGVRRWTSAGVAFGPQGQAAWRVLNAQFWGVPQRRRRIFVVADFRGQRAGQILFEPQGVPGDIEEGRKTREKITGGVEKGAGRSRGDGTELIAPEVAACLTTGTGIRFDAETETFITVRTFAIRTAQTSSNGWGVSEEVAYTLDLANGQAVAEVAAVDVRNLFMVAMPKVAGTLMASGAGLSRPAGMANETDFLVPQVAVCLNYQNPVRIGYRVRRLTPVECERLMGFPDGWTEGGSDTARYRALGNSVAVPCVEWIMRRIVEVVSGRME